VESYPPPHQTLTSFFGAIENLVPPPPPAIFLSFSPTLCLFWQAPLVPPNAAPTPPAAPLPVSLRSEIALTPDSSVGIVKGQIEFPLLPPSLNLSSSVREAQRVFCPFAFPRQIRHLFLFLPPQLFQDHSHVLHQNPTVLFLPEKACSPLFSLIPLPTCMDTFKD